MINSSKSQSSLGFTLIELIVAMTFFAFMMALISTGTLYIMRMYQAGIATKRTQNAARITMEDITREVRDADRIVTATPDNLCLEGAKVVLYQRFPDGFEADGVTQRYSLQKFTGSGSCGSPSFDPPIKLIDAPAMDVQAQNFTAGGITASGSNNASVKIQLTVTTGPSDLLEASGMACRPGPGSQFCSASSYSNVVSLRGAND